MATDVRSPHVRHWLDQLDQTNLVKPLLRDLLCVSIGVGLMADHLAWPYWLWIACLLTGLSQ